MNFHVLTLFPEMIQQGMNTSIIGRAITGGYLSVEAITSAIMRSTNTRKSMIILTAAAQVC